jgi:replicative superfamily II helicase
LTRSWKDHIFLLGAIDLLLLDEVHHLGDDRGSSLEIVVVRMRVLNQTCIARIKEHSEVEQRERYW